MNLSIYFAFFILLCNAGCALLLPVAAVTTGSVIIDKRSVGSVVDDNVIFSKIKTEFSTTRFNDIFTKVAVNVKEGRVMLTGYTKDEKYKKEATKIAWSVMGVKEVINEILIISDNSINTANDTWIANQLRTKFLFRKNFDSVNYNVAVSNSTVFLLGIGKNQQEIDAAIEMASSIKGVKKVISHALLQSDSRRIASY